VTRDDGGEAIVQLFYVYGTRRGAFGRLSRWPVKLPETISAMPISNCLRTGLRWDIEECRHSLTPFQAAGSGAQALLPRGG
jgi:hypothetical protein